MPAASRELWTCPKCGHRFVAANLWHSCGRYSLEEHFAGKDPIVRELFDGFCKLVRACGPVTIYPQKTRIICMARTRFAGCSARKKWLDVGFLLARRVRSPRVYKQESFGFRHHGHRLRLASSAELDRELAGWLREAYALGCQERPAEAGADAAPPPIPLDFLEALAHRPRAGAAFDRVTPRRRAIVLYWIEAARRQETRRRRIRRAVERFEQGRFL